MKSSSSHTHGAIKGKYLASNDYYFCLLVLTGSDRKV